MFKNESPPAKQLTSLYLIMWTACCNVMTFFIKTTTNFWRSCWAMQHFVKSQFAGLIPSVSVCVCVWTSYCFDIERSLPPDSEDIQHFTLAKVLSGLKQSLVGVLLSDVCIETSIGVNLQRPAVEMCVCVCVCVCVWVKLFLFLLTFLERFDSESPKTARCLFFFFVVVLLLPSIHFLLFLTLSFSFFILSLFLSSFRSLLFFLVPRPPPPSFLSVLQSFLPSMHRESDSESSSLSSYSLTVPCWASQLLLSETKQQNLLPICVCACVCVRACVCVCECPPQPSRRAHVAQTDIWICQYWPWIKNQIAASQSELPGWYDAGSQQTAARQYVFIISYQMSEQRNDSCVLWGDFSSSLLKNLTHQAAAHLPEVAINKLFSCPMIIFNVVMNAYFLWNWSTKGGKRRIWRLNPTINGKKPDVCNHGNHLAQATGASNTCVCRANGGWAIGRHLWVSIVTHLRRERKKIKGSLTWQTPENKILSAKEVNWEHL